MLPIPELHVSHIPVIISETLFALLFIAIWWKKSNATFYFEDHPDIFILLFSIIMGVVTNATMLGSITQPDETYYRDLFTSSFIFYNLLASTGWYLGILETLRILEHRGAKFRKIAVNFSFASFFLIVVIFGFSVAVVSLYVEMIDPDFDGNYQDKFTIYNNLMIATVLIRWLFFIFYTLSAYKCFSLVDRKHKDLLVAFGFLNTIPTLADSIYIITKSTFPNPIGLTFIMFVVTDLLIVGSIAMATFSWKVRIYTRLLPLTKPDTTQTTTPTTTAT